MAEKKNVWSEKQLAFMRWLCLPERKNIRTKKGKLIWEKIPVYRDPRTIVELAERLGVHRATLYEWQAQPAFKAALQKMSIQVMLDLEPEVNRVKLKNMLRPEGWQERLGHDRYTKPILYAVAAQGHLDEIRPGHELSEGDKQRNRELAMSKFDQLPRETKQEVLAFLEGIEAIAPSAQQVTGPTSTAYTVEAYADPDQEEEAEDDTIEGEVTALPAPSTRERKVNLGPDEDED